VGVAWAAVPCTRIPDRRPCLVGKLAETDRKDYSSQFATLQAAEKHGLEQTVARLAKSDATVRYGPDPCPLVAAAAVTALLRR
jgi:hypothetical protein